MGGGGRGSPPSRLIIRLLLCESQAFPSAVFGMEMKKNRSLFLNKINKKALQHNETASWGREHGGGGVREAGGGLRVACFSFC